MANVATRAVPVLAPTTPYLRRGDVLRWLKRWGVERADFEALVDAKVIQRVTITEKGRGYYLRDQVHLHLVKPLEENLQAFQAAEARKLGGGGARPGRDMARDLALHLKRENAAAAEFPVAIDGVDFRVTVERLPVPGEE